jgi:protein-S-isoprenylcysteine O-methyltransferase Ste14
MADRDKDNPRIFVPPPLIFVTALVIGLALDGRMSEPMPPPAPWAMIAGSATMLAGLGIILAALLTFLWKGARAEPWRGTDVLVVRGVYRLTRNPMYLGFAIVYSGLALLLQAPFAGLMLIPVLLIMDRLVIPREEAYLGRRFGEPYEAYRRSVRRWL